MNFRSIIARTTFALLLVSAAPAHAQSITNVIPPMGSFGQIINIGGSGFAPGDRQPNSLTVKFGTLVSTTKTNQVVGDTLIQAPVPTNAISGFISVSINGGPFVNSPNQFIVISTNAYVTNFSPLSGGANTTVTLNGVNFTTATNVMFNGVVSKTVAGLTPNIGLNFITVTAPDGVTTGPLVVMSKNGITQNFSTISNQVVPSATNFFAQPSITSFTPTFVRPGTNLAITGASFAGVTAVLFGGVNAVSFVITNNNSIGAVVPTNTSTGGIQINSPFTGPGLSTSNFRMLPTIFSFSPNFGPAGTAVTVTGAGLNEQSPRPTVTVGGGTVTTFGTISANSLSFNVPATAASGLISITTSNGSISSTQVFYLPPGITSFTPPGGGTGTIVTITGVNLTNATAVSFNGTPASTFFATNNTTLGAVVPSGVISGPISVTTPGGTATSTAFFLGSPSISSFTPTHGLPGTNVVITGLNFTNATAVLFNGIPSLSFNVSNNTTIAAIVPTGATTGPITVQSPGGSGTSSANFSFDAADVGVSATGSPNPVFIGSNLTYSIIVTNIGPVPASDVRVTNLLASSVTLKSASASQGTLFTGGNPITGDLGTINNNASASVTLVVTPKATGSITNSTTVGSDLSDPNLANNAAITTTTVWPLPFLSITNLTTNGLLQISWPVPLSGFTLQFTTNLSTNNTTWTNDSALKVVNGTNVSVTETNLGTARFFRLTN